MSELKVHRFITTDELFPEANAEVLYYEKSEADKAIAELKKEIEEQKRLRDMALASVPNALKVAKIIQHNKYKRCLAMAEACMHKRWRTDEGFDYARSNRHMNKWLELAEKFK